MRVEGGSASAIDIIVVATREMRGPILWAMSIIIVSMVPVLVLGEGSGAFLRPPVLTYALAVLVSMVVALTVTPALAVALLSRESLRLPSSRSPNGWGVGTPPSGALSSTGRRGCLARLRSSPWAVWWCCRSSAARA